jgi:hypothetical protein
MAARARSTRPAGPALSRSEPPTSPAALVSPPLSVSLYVLSAN